MIGNITAQPTIGVSDLNRAKAFYGDVLGLELAEENPYVLLYKSGDGQVEVYKTEFAGTNKATAVTWQVDDIEAEVTELLDKGVAFEHYDDMEGITRQGEVHIMGEDKAAWFKDPDGNILCVHE